GRGTFTYIGDVREVAAKMSALFVKLESPVLTDIAIAWPGAAEVLPREPGDLYAGEPIVVVAKTAATDGTVTITGRRASAPWSVQLPLSASASEPGLGVLWARAKIDPRARAARARPGRRRVGGAREDRRVARRSEGRGAGGRDPQRHHRSCTRAPP